MRTHTKSKLPPAVPIEISYTEYCKTRIFSAQFILALLAHSFICAKISSALNFHIVYAPKTIKFCNRQYWLTIIVHTEDALHVNVKHRQNHCNLLICKLICLQNKSRLSRSVMIVTGSCILLNKKKNISFI